MCSPSQTPCHVVVKKMLAIYVPMIYTAPYVILLMRADTLRGQVGGGWALEIKTFGPLGKCHIFGTQKGRDLQGPTPFDLPK
jgi:hypothetical protein